MFIYNVTTKVQHSIADAWLAWLKQYHIPDLINTGCFTHAVILHLLEADDEEGKTYAVQYYFENKNAYDQYLNNHAQQLRQKTFAKWGDQFISFRSVMQVVD